MRHNPRSPAMSWKSVWTFVLLNDRLGAIIAASIAILVVIAGNAWAQSAKPGDGARSLPTIQMTKPTIRLSPKTFRRAYIDSKPTPYIQATKLRPAAKTVVSPMRAAALAATLEAPTGGLPGGQPITCVPNSDQPIEIVALAASLKCDVDLIFEFVYNNIEYEAISGSNKGALGTLLDLRGSDMDQAQLFVALLRAAGYATAQTSFMSGVISIDKTQAASWLGVAADTDPFILYAIFAAGGIPVGCPDVATCNTLVVERLFVQVEIEGVGYVFDPAYKQYDVSPGIADLGSRLGYSRNAFLSDAGGTVSPSSSAVSDLNRAAVRNDLVAYAQNLIAHIKTTNPAWMARDVIGGKSIRLLAGSPLRQKVLPNISPAHEVFNLGSSMPSYLRTCLTIAMPGVTPATCATWAPGSATIVLATDEIYGKRITISSVPDGTGTYIPTLLIDGAPPPNGQNTGTAKSFGEVWTITVATQHFYDFSVTQCPHVGDVDQCRAMGFAAGGAYLVTNGWGQVGRGMVEKHRTLLGQARASGAADTSEVVIGESLAVIGYAWLAELSTVMQLGDPIAKVFTHYFNGVGIVGLGQIQNHSGVQGPYIDLPINAVKVGSLVDTSADPEPNVVGSFLTNAGVLSALESAVLEQTQALVAGVQAASTIRLVDQNAGTSGGTTYLADGTSATGVSQYFTYIRPNLAYTCSPQLMTLAAIDLMISVDGTSTGQPTGNQVLLPANGCVAVGSYWNGAGLTVIKQTATNIEVSQKISGGLSGGFLGYDVPTPDFSLSTYDTYKLYSDFQNLFTDLSQPPFDFTQTIADPVDATTGTYTYQHVDLTTGSGSFPYALPFGRTYTSSANRTDVGLGNGWAHSYSISVSRNSDPFAGLGATSAIASAAAIAAIYVSQDLLADTNQRDAKRLTVAWMVNRWLVDQLTHNSVVVSWPGTGEQFTILPQRDGSATGSYAAPLGSAVVLTGSLPDANGGFTVFTYRGKDQTQIAFNALNADLLGKIASWTWPNGMSLGFTYDGSGRLATVSNNLGRNLTLAYDANGRIVSVRDDTGRTIGYGYDASGNQTAFTDPLQKQTTFAYDGNNRLTQVFYPSLPTLPFLTNVYNGIGRISRQLDAVGNLSFFYVAGSRTEQINPAGDRLVIYQTPRGRIVKQARVLSAGFGNVFNDTPQQNGAVNVWSSQYDGQDRLIKATAPEGGKTEYTYSLDLLHNLTEAKRTPKPGSPLVALSSKFEYDPTYSKPSKISEPCCDPAAPGELVTRLSYDPATGNLLNVVRDWGVAPHLNATARFGYNAQGQVVSATDPNGVITRYTYDDFGSQISVAGDAAGLNRITTLGYDAQGNTISVTDPNGNTSRSTYDLGRRLIRATGPPAAGSAVTTFTYDADDRLVLTQQSSGGTVLRTLSTSYTPTGQKATTTDANGNVTRYAYDTADRLASLRDPLGRTTRYAYDTMGRRTQVLNATIQAAPLLRQAYTPDGFPASLTDAIGSTTSYAYDGFDRLAVATYPLGSTEQYGYDAGGNVLSRVTRAGQTIAFAYDTLNRLTTKTPPNPAPVVSYRYDLTGRLLGVSDTGAAIPSVVPPTGTTAIAYTASTSYDALNRPRSVTWDNVIAPVMPSTSAVTFTHGYNAANQRSSQQTTDDGWWYVPSGPTIPGNTFSYGYDAENRLTAATATGVNASYAYDAQGRRKQKTVGATSTVYVTDPENREVVEYDGSSGVIQRWYVYGLGIDELVAQVDVAASFTANNPRLTTIPDIQGSVIGTIDASSGAVSKAGYTPFGESASTSGAYRYTGRRIDAETGGLYYYRARTYDPLVGRFLQTDPIGYAGGLNGYAYVDNDPLNFVDPFGLAADAAQDSAGDGARFAFCFICPAEAADPFGRKVHPEIQPRAIPSGRPLPADSESTSRVGPLSPRYDGPLPGQPAGNVPKAGRYEFPDQAARGTPYVGQSGNIPKRLEQHERAGRYEPGTATTTAVPGGKTAREVSEHQRIREITGGVPARQSDAVSNQLDPIGPNRQYLLPGE